MKHLMPRTVAGQLIAVAMLALIVSQIAVFVIMVGERQSAIRGWWNNYILGRIASAVELLDAIPADLHQNVLDASDSRLLTFAIAATEPSHQTGTTVPSQETAIDEDATTYQSELQAMTGKDLAMVIVEIADPPSSLEVVQHWIATWQEQPVVDTDPWLEASVKLNNNTWLSIEVARHIQPPSLALLLIPVGTMLLVFGSALIIVIRQITRPINKLAEAAEAFGRGEEVLPVTVLGPAEIRQAIEAFNEMRERLSRFVLDRTKMLAAVGHDLRTPITTMRLRAEFIEDDETRSRILASLEEMQQLAEAALAFAREEAVAETTRIVDLNALVQTVCADQADLRRKVVYQENGRMLYRCRPNSLKRAIRNLVENAVVHGKSAQVALHGPYKGVRITIEDEGPGIPEENLTQVFVPFVRLDASRGQETGGIGLGLAIARSIVRGHGGDIEIENRQQGGLSATIQLPVNG